MYVLYALTRQHNDCNVSRNLHGQGKGSREGRGTLLVWVARPATDE